MNDSNGNSRMAEYALQNQIAARSILDQRGVASANQQRMLGSLSTADHIRGLEARAEVLTEKLREADSWRKELTEIQAMLHALNESRKATSDE